MFTTVVLTIIAGNVQLSENDANAFLAPRRLRRNPQLRERIEECLEECWPCSKEESKECHGLASGSPSGDCFYDILVSKSCVYNIVNKKGDKTSRAKISYTRVLSPHFITRVALSRNQQRKANMRPPGTH